MVKFVALNCTTCVHLPVRKPEFRKNVQTCNSVFPEKDKIKGDIIYLVSPFIFIDSQKI